MLVLLVRFAGGTAAGADADAAGARLSSPGEFKTNIAALERTWRQLNEGTQQLHRAAEALDDDVNRRMMGAFAQMDAQWGDAAFQGRFSAEARRAIDGMLDDVKELVEKHNASIEDDGDDDDDDA